MSGNNNSAITIMSPLFWGHSGSWWDGALIAAVLVTFIAAGFVALATVGSIFAHTRESKAAEFQLERYKTETAGKVADAHATGVSAGERAGNAQAAVDAARVEIEKQKALAAQAQLETARLQAEVSWRRLSEKQFNSIVRAALGSRGFVNIRYTANDPESLAFAEEIRQAFERGGWQVGFGGRQWHQQVYGLAVSGGGLVTIPPSGVAAVLREAGLSSAALPTDANFNEYQVTTIPGATTLMVGSKPRPH